MDMAVCRDSLRDGNGPLTQEHIDFLDAGARRARADAVLMTSVAGSGHPAGSLSSMEMCIAVLGAVRGSADCPERDRVVISHGHVSPAVYGALGFWGVIDRADAVAHFRQTGSPYQGHVERSVPGVDWGTGNLGQGLSAGVGFALAARALGSGARTYVLMGDGEQVKGQVAEARRVAVKEKLNSITALVDVNGIQICGATGCVMPSDIKGLWEVDGWRVLSVDGHSFGAIYDAMREARTSDVPVVILCNTVMGKGVSFMEGTPDYHGKAASGAKVEQALSELGFSPDEFSSAKAARNGAIPHGRAVANTPISVDTGTAVSYDVLEKTDNRSAFGRALAEMGELNCKVPGRTPLLVFDCDLAGSVKVDKFAALCSDCFVETGIQEHATATVAGAASTAGVVPVWAAFGMFGITEVYNQQRLNDINGAAMKLALTHVGLDVGEDGMTHQCIDYVGLLRNTFGWKVVVPADPNLTDRVTRWAMNEPCCVCIAMGRSSSAVVTDDDGGALFGEGYTFRYGALDVVRRGTCGVILAMGASVKRAVAARDILLGLGHNVSVLHTASPLAVPMDELLSHAVGGAVLTLEDHHADTGLGATVAMGLARMSASVPFDAMGVTRYGDSGSSADVIAAMGLNPDDIAARYCTLAGAARA